MTFTNLNDRLAALPPKTYLPLAALTAAGQIDEAFLELLLDAAALSGDEQRLLGFAAGYLHMTKVGVPVEDVIRMAKRQERRINLTWSPSRWRDEHSKLSRAETLARLSTTNEVYDLSTYEVHLPEAARRTLIRSSKRLGFEGLRQRHCVASYHDRIMRGGCAIASVIVERQRWTVQLERTGIPDTPLAITQIKTRLNGIAPPDIRRKIHALMHIKQHPGDIASESVPETIYLDNLRRVLPLLEGAGIETVLVTFSGSGDSGAVDWVYFKPDQPNEFSRAQVPQLRMNSFFEDGRWSKAVVPETMTLREALTNITDDYLEEAGVNWYDNDGGYGELEIDVAARSVSLDINVNYTESTNEFCETKSIDTGEVDL
jgi:hypothetical protein